MIDQVNENEVENDGKVKIEIAGDKYVDSKSANGSKTKHNGDPIATALAGQSVDAVYGIAAEMLSADKSELEEKYAHLNVGQQRMNLGNRIRGAVNRMTKAHEKDAEKTPFDGESYLSQVMESYPLPEPEVAEATESGAEE